MHDSFAVQSKIVRTPAHVEYGMRDSADPRFLPPTIFGSLLQPHYTNRSGIRTHGRRSSSQSTYPVRSWDRPIQRSTSRHFLPFPRASMQTCSPGSGLSSYISWGGGLYYPTRQAWRYLKPEPRVQYRVWHFHARFTFLRIFSKGVRLLILSRAIQAFRSSLMSLPCTCRNPGALPAPHRVYTGSKKTNICCVGGESIPDPG